MANKTPEAAQPQDFKTRIWQPYLGPILALCAICLVTSFLLAITNNATAPLIEENTRKAADAARQALLPEADGFDTLEVGEDLAGVTAMYQATNGAGTIIEANAKGYGGPIPVMVAFNDGGQIVGVTFLQNSETPGLGKKLETDPAFAAQFAGREAQQMQLGDIDKIASSTVSSSGALTAINSAIEAYNRQVLGMDTDGVAGATEQGEEAA